MRSQFLQFPASRLHRAGLIERDLPSTVFQVPDSLNLGSNFAGFTCRRFRKRLSFFQSRTAECNHSMKIMNRAEFDIGHGAGGRSFRMGASRGLLAAVRGCDQRCYSCGTATQCRHMGSSTRVEVHFVSRCPSFSLIVYFVYS